MVKMFFYQKTFSDYHRREPVAYLSFCLTLSVYYPHTCMIVSIFLPQLLRAGDLLVPATIQGTPKLIS
jgi:hypothetical protein